jgi:hypothetical protein
VSVENYAVIENGVVSNVIVWDGDSDWQPPDGATTVQITSDTGVAYIGGTYENGRFAAPTQQVPVGT